MTSNELVLLLASEIKGLSSYVVSADYTNAISEAQLETGWTLPVADSFKVLWLKRRAKRHLIFMLYTEAASKFKVDQISLGDRFKHYGELIKAEDAAFAAVLEDRAEMFADANGIGDPVAYFGVQVGTRHSYDELGRDVTDYGDDAIQQ
jgi:hypothetical protein